MDEIQQFIMNHAHSDVNALRLQYHGKAMPFSVEDACMQIEMRRKTSNKLTWFLKNPGFMFGTSMSAEQATNQNVAQFHAQLIGHDRRVLDMTAGLGIDAMTIALNGNTVTAYELEHERVRALRHNAGILNVNNMSVVEGDSVLHLQQSHEHYDWIFVDPARRDSGNNRCFLLRDSLPDVITHQDLLLAHADHVLIKASPLLDVTQTLRDFRHVRSIFILSFKNEVKKVLIHLGIHSLPFGTGPEGDVQSNQSRPLIHVIDLADSPDSFPAGTPAIRYTFTCTDAVEARINYATPEHVVTGMYFYEAGAAMRKLQCALQICDRYPGMKSLAKDSGLFVSDTLYMDFPGRISTINALVSGRELKALKGSRCRVVSSCFPVSASELRKKCRLMEGEDRTFYATTTHDGTRLMMLTTR